MAKAVLVQISSSSYDDRPGESYHFPARYKKRIEQVLGDWVVFYRPVKDVGVSKRQQGHYFAVARLTDLAADLSIPDHFYVGLEPSSYIEFSTPVPRMWKGRFIEPRLDGGSGRANSGLSQNAVREIDDISFQRILNLGWREPEWAVDRFMPSSGMAEEAAVFDHGEDREIVVKLSNRVERDRRFRQLVLTAYSRRCAITGWEFINGGGRPEVQAAHIKPVSEKGPDSIRNGLALSGTVHWMFDRGLIGIDGQDNIHIHRKVNDRDSIERLIHPDQKLIRPTGPENQPHPKFLEWHWNHHAFAS